MIYRGPGSPPPSPFRTAKKQYVLETGNKYSQKRNCTATVLISTFACLSAICIFPQSICVFCCKERCGPTLGIYKSITDTTMRKFWDRGRAIPRKEYINEIFVAVRGKAGKKREKRKGKNRKNEKGGKRRER
jgi:hypothetical protein